MTARARLVPLTNKHWSSSGEDTALVTRQRGFDSRPVLLIFDNLVIAQRTHDVADAYLLARQKVPVRLRLGALSGVWESLGFRVLREHEIAGSNPAAPTYCGGTRVGTGRRLLIALTQVRFLPPQLTTKRKGKPTGDGSRLESGRAAMPWEFDSPSFRLHVPLAERQRLQPSKWRGEFDSRRALSGIG